MKRNSEASEGKQRRPQLRWRVLISIAVGLHVLAVFIPPFIVATRSGPGTYSPFAEPLMQVFKPYIDLLYLDHGYFFFAPNPGPSHLLRAELEFADGRPSRELMFPDREAQRPRLLYHRHFMLAEQLHAEFVPSEPPPEILSDPDQLSRYHEAKARYEMRRRSFEEHLAATYGASKVTITRVEHTLIAPFEYAAGARSLNDANTFIDLPESGEPRMEPGLMRGPGVMGVR